MIALVPTHYSRAIIRIGDALKRYAPPDVSVRRIAPLRKDSRRSSLVPGEEEGDTVILLVNGLRDHQVSLATRCLERGQKYVVVQIALRTTRHPLTEQWRKFWAEAAAVWSYYPLHEWIEQERGPAVDFNFYHAPLGVDASVFYDRSVGSLLDRAVDRTYTVCTSGQRRNQEGVAECDDAAHWIKGQIFQLGPTFSMRSNTTYMTDISDNALAEMYSHCQFVSGLRRHEGFELPAAEGLLCGARPLLFDKSHYRCWFEPWGEFIPEKDAGDVTRHLVDLFKAGPRPVTDDEKAAAAQRFNWETIVAGFWSAVANG